MNVWLYIKKENGDWKWWAVLILVLTALRLGNVAYSYFYNKRQNVRINALKMHMNKIGLGKPENRQISNKLAIAKEKYTEFDMLYEIQMGLIWLKHKIFEFVL